MFSQLYAHHVMRPQGDQYSTEGQKGVTAPSGFLLGGAGGGNGTLFEIQTNPFRHWYDTT